MKENHKSIIIFCGVLSLFIFGMQLSAIAQAKGLKKIVTVSTFDNKTSLGNKRDDINLKNSLADQLSAALIQSGQFIVLERKALDQVMKEQNLGNNERFDKSTFAKSGKLIGSQVLIKGTIEEIKTESNSSKSAISFGGFNLGSKETTTKVALTIRLIDTTTGALIEAQRAVGRIKTRGLDLDIDYKDINFGSNSFKTTPIGKATKKAIDKAVDYIAKRLKDLPFRARVIKVTGNGLYLSAGAKHGTSVGDVFNVFSAGEVLIDPETGETLGIDEINLGQVKIINVQEKFSKANTIGNLKGVKAGDVVRFN